MIKFFLSFRFWLPVILLILLELSLRLGMLNWLVKPRSFLGNSIYRLKAIKNFGLEKIHWITIGDSTIDWGIDHGKVLKTSIENKNPHVRMSFESAYLNTYQGVADWSFQQMPNLKGVVYGLNVNRLSSMGSHEWDNRILQPFRTLLDLSTTYPYEEDSNTFPLSAYYKIQTLSIIIYTEYIKQYLQQPVDIHKWANKKNEKILNELHYSRNIPYDNCKYHVKNLKECVDMAEKLKNDKELVGSAKYIVDRCGSAAAIARSKIPLFSHKLSAETVENHTQFWTSYFRSILDKNIQLVIIILPDTSLMRNYINPANTNEIKNQVFSNIQEYNNLKIIDFSEIFHTDECSYFSDYLHFNNDGIDLLTNKLLDTLPHLNSTPKNSTQE